MRWGDFRVKNWDDMWKAVLSIAIVIIIVFMLVDFISWRTALDIIKKELPTSWQPPSQEYIKGLGYVPLIWKGNFQYVRIWKYKNPHSMYIDNIFLEFKTYNPISVNLEKISDNLWYGNYVMTEACKSYIEERRDGWEKMNQPIGTYAEIYVRIKDNKVLVLILGEHRTFMREFKTTLYEGGCGGGYTLYSWGTL